MTRFLAPVDVTGVVCAEYAATFAIEAETKTPSEKGLIERAVLVAVGELAAVHHTIGTLDSHQLADVVFECRARDCDWVQTKDYTQFVLREAPHVCRHADGHHYTVHVLRECSADCDTKRAQNKAHITTDLCPSCFVRMNVAGQCDLCEYGY